MLSGPAATSVVDVVRRITAVQAQDPRGARLALRARSSGLTAADVDRALTHDRSVVITTLNRGTLHLVCREDYWWLHALTTPQLATSSARRLEQEQVSPADADLALEVVEEALRDAGALSRGALRGRIAAAGVRVEGQALVHILFLGALRGLILRGPVVDGEHAYVLVRDWLGPPPPAQDRPAMLAELAHRYLRGHGPADARDLARWAGVTLGDARRGLTALAGELAWREDGRCALGDGPPAARLPPPRLLGSFDPVLHGWTSREEILGGHPGVVTTNGIFRPFATSQGRAVATWTLTRRDVTIRPFAPLTRAVARALEADAERVVRFLDGR